MSPNRAASVRARLLNWSKQEKQEFQRVLVRFGLERLLYRLSISNYREEFVLKGALLFWLWEGAIARPTRDADVLLRGDVAQERIKAMFVDLCQMEADDGIVFDPGTIEVSEIRGEEEYHGVRVRVVLRANLGTAQIRLQVDVATGDVVTPGPEHAEFPTLIPMDAPQLLVYPRVTVVAEKLHAVVNLGIENSRLKDYFDLDRLGARYSFDGHGLVTAIRATFERRRTELPTGLPPGLSPAFAESEVRQRQWRAFQNRLTKGDGRRLLEVIEGLRAFLVPPLEAAARPEAFNRAWPLGGPWS